MHLPRFRSIILWLAACTCTAAHAQTGLNADPGAIANQIATLQAARRTGLPSTIGPDSKLYRTIQKLGKAEVSKQEAANELVEWLFVTEPPPDSFEPVNERLLHPASNSLIAIGTEAVEPLQAKLKVVTTDREAILILRCLRHIYKDNFKLQLLHLKAQNNSAVVNQAIDRVFNEGPEVIGVTLEPVN